MSHLDAERLMSLAMGEPAGEQERDHLEGCAECSLELAELEYTVTVGRSTATIGDIEAPPERVWARITEELGLGTGVAQETSAPVAFVEDEPTEPGVRDTGRPAAITAAGRPRGWRMMFALAATVALAFAAVGTWALIQPGAPKQVAAATLEAFPAHPEAFGEAIVREGRDGVREITVTLDAAEAEEGFREVWLITADASALVSLGVIDGREAVFPVPEGVDLHEFVLVDVSLEPVDDDPAHSGDSIVRGELSFA